MNVIFKDDDLKTIYYEGKIAKGRYKQLCRNIKLVEGYRRAVFLMLSVENSNKLSEFSFLHYEKLKHSAMSSVRIQNGAVERLLFTEKDDGIEVELIEIDDTHYGNR